MLRRFATIDFHVTSECSQECPYCWGPQEVPAVDTATALAIVGRIAAVGARRIVFTGGDPLKREDLGTLISRARRAGLQVALSTTGDLLTAEFLTEHAAEIDLVSLPLDGADEEVSQRTKKEGHCTAVLAALDRLAAHPGIDVKVATPVTRHNLADVPSIVRLLDERAAVMPNRVFYNVFQAFPRSMDAAVAWESLLVSAAEFAALEEEIAAAPHRFRINWLSHATLDRLYVMVFPDGTLVVPVGGSYRSYGPFLEVGDLDEVLARADFDAAKHLRHSRGWGRRGGTPAT
ncbi:MAG TPA: radical SAM protein [Acidimicrobiia bacterium]|nr:radical SAM protein [Acidimicrobiia bacterium]